MRNNIFKKRCNFGGHCCNLNLQIFSIVKGCARKCWPRFSSTTNQKKFVRPSIPEFYLLSVWSNEISSDEIWQTRFHARVGYKKQFEPEHQSWNRKRYRAIHRCLVVHALPAAFDVERPSPNNCDEIIYWIFCSMLPRVQWCSCEILPSGCIYK